KANGFLLALDPGSGSSIGRSTLRHASEIEHEIHPRRGCASRCRGLAAGGTRAGNVRRAFLNKVRANRKPTTIVFLSNCQGEVAVMSKKAQSTLENLKLAVHG